MVPSSRTTSDRSRWSASSSRAPSDSANPMAASCTIPARYRRRRPAQASGMRCRRSRAPGEADRRVSIGLRLAPRPGPRQWKTKSQARLHCRIFAPARHKSHDSRLRLPRPIAVGARGTTISAVHVSCWQAVAYPATLWDQSPISASRLACAIRSSRSDDS